MSCALTQRRPGRSPAASARRAAGPAPGCRPPAPGAPGACGSTCLTVSARGSAGTTAGAPARTAAITVSTVSTGTSGRAASCTSTTSMASGSAARPRRTESWRVSPPGTTTMSVRSRQRVLVEKVADLERRRRAGRPRRRGRRRGRRPSRGRRAPASGCRPGCAAPWGRRGRAGHRGRRRESPRRCGSDGRDQTSKAPEFRGDPGIGADRFVSSWEVGMATACRARRLDRTPSVTSVEAAARARHATGSGRRHAAYQRVAPLAERVAAPADMPQRPATDRPGKTVVTRAPRHCCVESHADDTQSHFTWRSRTLLDAQRRQDARTSSSRASALSSLVFSARASSLTRIWRALASILFSPAESPRSRSRRHRSRTTSATLMTSPEASFSRFAL